MSCPTCGNGPCSHNPAPVAPSGVPVKTPRKRKQKGPTIEIEELWQPNEEQKENLAKKIDWRTAIKYLNKLADTDAEKAFHAVIALKDLVEADRFADIMVEFAPYGSCELFEKVSKYGVKRSGY